MSKKTLRDKSTRWLFHALRLPGILEADEAAARLGLPPHVIPILLGAGHIKALGKIVRKKTPVVARDDSGKPKPPADKTSKKFSSDYIEGLIHDQAWLHKAILIIDSHWSDQNKKKKEKKCGLNELPKAA
jgi:hypothetical protein